MSETRPRIGPRPETSASFADVVLPHLGDARRLASWLVPNQHDAEDAVQEASLRALRYFGTFAGGNARAWFLCIVRHTCAGLRDPRPTPPRPFDADEYAATRADFDPEALLLQRAAADTIARVMHQVPARSRQLLVLRELQGLSYREITKVVGIPVGTVMSRLSRARQALRRAAERLHVGPAGPAIPAGIQRRADSLRRRPASVGGHAPAAAALTRPRDRRMTKAAAMPANQAGHSRQRRRHAALPAREPNALVATSRENP
jgi:RNA polymerase sigma-70 factor, ECF subfamily